MTHLPALQLKVPFGSRNGILLAPDDVLESGLACGCACPGCGAPLVLRQGTKRRHFSHHRVQGTTHCVESAIHAAAIQVLCDANWMHVPEKFVSASVPTKSGSDHGRFEVLRPARVIRFDYSRKEHTFADQNGKSIRADVVGFRGEKQMIVEMCFTHAVDDEKKAFLRQLGLPAIEIVLSDLDLDAGFDAVRERVLENNVYKEWLFHPGEDEARTALLARVIEEAALLDKKFDAKQAREERQRRDREERNAAQERERQEALAQYRAMPIADKDRRLRTQLGIAGAWPRHLQVMNAKNDAIAAPPRLWQASVFHRFVFQKPTDDYSFTLDQATVWVVERFEKRPDTGFSVMDAVRSFLAYLKGCGFVHRHYNPYDSDRYTIVHHGLMPPPRNQEQKDVRKRAAHPVPSSISSQRLAWCASLPDYSAAMQAATSSVASSVCIDIVTYLYRAPDRIASPRTLANEFRGRGVSEHFIYEFLIRAGIAYEDRQGGR
jgi:hypothetical protein